ncbi:MAG: glycosyltransferase family 4 protein [Pseudomonadota bacterium]
MGGSPESSIAGSEFDPVGELGGKAEMSAASAIEHGPAASPAPVAARASGAGVDVVFVIHQIGSSADGGLRSISEMIANAPGLSKCVLTNLETKTTAAWRAHADVRIWRMNEQQYTAGDSGPFARLWRGVDRLRNNARMWGLLRELRPAAVHVNDHRAFWNAIIAAKLVGAPVIFNVRDTMRPGAKSTWAWRLALKLADRFLVLSKEMEESWRRDLQPASLEPKHASKFAYLYSIVDPAVYGPVDDARRGELRSELKMEAGRKAVVYVGRFEEKKAQLPFIEQAIPKLKAENPDALVYFVGDFAPEKDAYAAACADAIERLGLQDAVRCVGYSARIADWYRASDVVALASQREGLPRCVIEALACGATIATFDVCSTREVVEAHEFGFVVSQGDYAGLSAAIDRALGDEELRAAVRVRAPQFTAQTFDPRRNGARYAEFVKSVVSAKNAEGAAS